MTEQNDYLADDARQVEPGELIAFNVPITSSNARANELIEMLRFVQDAVISGVASHIERVRYDSQEGVCHIDGGEACSLHERVQHQLLGAARKHLTRFTLCGVDELDQPLRQNDLYSQPRNAAGYPDAADNDGGISGAATGNANTAADQLRHNDAP